MGNKAKRSVCRDVVMLFRNYHGFPQTSDVEGKTDADGSRELVGLIDALERWTVNEDHARAVGRKLLEESTFCPRVVDFKNVGEELRPQFSPKVIGVACGGKCAAGFIVTIDENGIARSRYCECHPGRPQPGSEPIPKHPQSPKSMKHVLDGRMKAGGE